MRYIVIILILAILYILFPKSSYYTPGEKSSGYMKRSCYGFEIDRGSGRRECVGLVGKKHCFNWQNEKIPCSKLHGIFDQSLN